MKYIDAALTVLDQWVSGLALIVNLVLLFVNVIGRYFFSYSLQFAEDIGRYLLIVVIYLGMSYCVKTNSHVRVEFCMNLYPPRVRPFIEIIGDVIWMLYCAFIVVVSAKYALHYYDLKSMIASVRFPIWPVYAVIPLGHCTMGLRVLMGLLLKTRILFKGEATV
jgi:TRAP-type C4-dicarboxylate transport system permease small subunit